LLNVLTLSSLASSSRSKSRAHKPAQAISNQIAYQASPTDKYGVSCKRPVGRRI
jgi:hypothetical protein